jgi:hypothetical protein
MRTVVVAALFALNLGTSVAQESAQTGCLTAAFNDYNKANLAIKQRTPPLPIEAIVAQRRLQEQYCLRVARCRVGEPATDRSLASSYAAAFSSCLAEEAKAQRGGGG